MAAPQAWIAKTTVCSHNLTPRRTDVSLQRCLFLTLLLATIASPALADSGDFTGLVDISGGRNMYLECHGTGSPTVFIVPGGKAAADDWTKESPVFTDVAKFTRVCAYDRP